MTPEICMSAVYVCHTYYHVFVSFLKEFKRSGGNGTADIILSTMSNDFESMADRIRESGVFRNVYSFDEKRDINFPDVMKWKKDRGNILFNMFARIIYTRKLAKKQEPFVPVDFKSYKEIYVFCDIDPIGYYLNMNHIYYHAVEDGLDTLRPCVYARTDNAGAWKLKRFLSKKMNLIFIRDGYGKYCLDMEVNNLGYIKDDPDVYIEEPRNALMDALTDDQKKIILKVFVKNYDGIIEISRSMEGGNNILVLTEPLLESLEDREKLFRDIVETYSKEGKVFLKPHPRDALDYPTVFADVPQFDRSVPMELLNFFKEMRFKKVISIYTQLGSIQFADEKVFLGNDFMDKYEDPSVHSRMKDANN